MFYSWPMDLPLIRVVPAPDLAALLLFCAVWLGYGPAVRMLGRRGGRAINAGLPTVRVLWMRSAVLRDNRITDSALIGHVVHSASFFASTSLIAIGTLIGVLSGLDRLMPALAGLAPALPTSRELLEVKVLLPLAVLVHGLFKLTWALRQLNYTVALIGAMPPPPVPAAEAEGLAEAVGGVLSSALTTFNAGTRSYYFALAAFGWLAGPYVLAAAGLGLMALLVHRQFLSDVSGRFATARLLIERAHGRGGQSPP